MFGRCCEAWFSSLVASCRLRSSVRSLAVPPLRRFRSRGPGGVNAALATLRADAVAHGFPGVFVLGSIYVGTCVADVGWDYFAAMLNGETWDALTPGSEPAAACPRDGAQPYPDLVQ